MARGNKSSASLAPGFRFHPTDEELIRYYLKRKVTNKPFRFDPIAVVDIYKTEPWDLPDKSKLKSRDLEWYFFSVLDKKYGNGSKTNRATEKGYWKTTGKDRPVHWNSRTVGMKKTLVYHLGRAPRGERSNWVMHEYRLTDEDLEKAGVIQDAFVLCRIFQKSGTGPKNGEQYGAPFVEEEWDDGEMVALLPGEEMVVTDEAVLLDDACFESDDLDQNYNVGVASENTALPMNYCHGETSNSAGDHNKPVIDEGEIQSVSDIIANEQNLFIMPGHYEIDAKSVRHEFIAESGNKADTMDNDCLLDEMPFMDAINDPSFSEGLFLETSDLLNPMEPESAKDSTVFDMVDEYLNFFDANDDNLSFDPYELLASESTIASEQVPVPEKEVDDENEEVAVVASGNLAEAQNDTDASSSNQHKLESDFMKQASHMLGGISAPPAFASEFPIKGSALQLNAPQSSTSIRVTAGIIRIESITFGGFPKNANLNIVLSFAISQENATINKLASWACFFFMFLWVLLLSLTSKIAATICAM